MSPSRSSTMRPMRGRTDHADRLPRVPSVRERFLAVYQALLVVDALGAERVLVRQDDHRHRELRNRNRVHPPGVRELQRTERGRRRANNVDA